MTYLVHIVAGALGLLTGYVALYAAKGGKLHRKSGLYIVAGVLPLGRLLDWLVRVRVWPLITRVRAPRMAQSFPST